MTRKIFHSILSVALAVLAACLLIITGVLYEYFGSVQEKELRDELSLAAAATETMGESYLHKLSSDRYRLTWVDPDGNVIYDTQVDAASMENHSGREEIREALAAGTGSSRRYSATLMEKTLYEATRLADGSVLRISVSRATAALLVVGMLQPIAILAILAFALSWILARRMAKRVVEPLNTLDLERPMENDAYEELSPLLRRIHAQHQKIQRQKQRLKQKQDEFDQITGHMKEGLVLLDDKGKIVSINPAARTLFGASRFCESEDFLTISRRQDMRTGVSAAMETGHHEFRACLGGREYQFDLSRIESNGSIHGLVILAFDVTEQIHAEQSRREFTANVSHELKTPLQSIIGSAELMENGIVKPEDVPIFVGRIRQEASRLVILIDDIIRLSQLDEGSELPREETSLLALSEEVCRTLADAAKRKNVSLTVTGDPGMVVGARRLLFEIIYNLCDNAIKYNVTGGSVDIRVEEGTEGVRITVKDTGIGIAPEHQEKVFERFYRVDKSHSKQSGGTGLGLSIVKHAVSSHGGKLTMASDPGKGTAISILFPKTE